MDIFYLGTHQPHWLWKPEAAGIHFFVSRKRLCNRKSFGKATTPWALDSGGFSELRKNGEWSVTETEYMLEVRRYSREIGNLNWAAPQDWMCEPHMLKNTGLTIEEHQNRTTASFLNLRERAPMLPWIPVLQGWEPQDYLRHVAQYETHGVDLRAQHTVGVGSVCRRQHTRKAHHLIEFIVSRTGLQNLHLFGFKTQGLQQVQDIVKSSDSMSWSFTARYDDPLPECVGTHKNCANCLRYARRWQQNLFEKLRTKSAA